MSTDPKNIKIFNEDARSAVKEAEETKVDRYDNTFSERDSVRPGKCNYYFVNPRESGMANIYVAGDDLEVFVFNQNGYELRSSVKTKNGRALMIGVEVNDDGRYLIGVKNIGRSTSKYKLKYRNYITHSSYHEMLKDDNINKYNEYKIESKYKFSNLGTDSLSKGSCGIAVKSLQIHLYECGYLEKRDIDGEFGYKTEKAVKEMKLAYGFKEDALNRGGSIYGKSDFNELFCPFNEEIAKGQYINIKEVKLQSSSEEQACLFYCPGCDLDDYDEIDNEIKVYIEKDFPRWSEMDENVDFKIEVYDDGELVGKKSCDIKEDDDIDYFYVPVAPNGAGERILDIYIVVDDLKIKKTQLRVFVLPEISTKMISNLSKNTVDELQDLFQNLMDYFSEEENVEKSKDKDIVGDLLETLQDIVQETFNIVTGGVLSITFSNEVSFIFGARTGVSSIWDFSADGEANAGLVAETVSLFAGLSAGARIGCSIVYYPFLENVEDCLGSSFNISGGFSVGDIVSINAVVNKMDLKTFGIGFSIDTPEASSVAGIFPKVSYEIEIGFTGKSKWYDIAKLDRDEIEAYLNESRWYTQKW